MSKKKAESVVPEASKVEKAEKGAEKLWIYPGERRPIMVLAKNERHAKYKVEKSPDYDGFPVYVHLAEEFANRCLPEGGTKIEVPEVNEEPKPQAPVTAKPPTPIRLVKIAVYFNTSYRSLEFFSIDAPLEPKDVAEEIFKHARTENGFVAVVLSEVRSSNGSVIRFPGSVEVYAKELGQDIVRLTYEDRKDLAGVIKGMEAAYENENKSLFYKVAQPQIGPAVASPITDALQAHLQAPYVTFQFQDAQGINSPDGDLDDGSGDPEDDEE